MTDKEKASKVLDYLQELGDTELVINILHPYLTDEQLASIYDKFEQANPFKAVTGVFEASLPAKVSLTLGSLSVFSIAPLKQASSPIQKGT